MHGPVNMTAPNPVTNAEFTRSLARALHRPAFFTAPGLLLKLVMGERSALLLEGQCVLPTKFEDTGFHFRFSELEIALQDLLD
jgi:NAD dependent epimerase/dehydratase family enzyme